MECGRPSHGACFPFLGDGSCLRGLSWAQGCPSSYCASHQPIFAFKTACPSFISLCWNIPLCSPPLHVSPPWISIPHLQCDFSSHWKVPEVSFRPRSSSPRDRCSSSSVKEEKRWEDDILVSGWTPFLLCSYSFIYSSYFVFCLFVLCLCPIKCKIRKCFPVSEMIFLPVSFPQPFHI